MESILNRCVFMGDHTPHITKLQLGCVKEVEYGFRIAEITIETKKRDTDKLLISLLEDRHPDIKRLANTFVIIGDVSIENAEVFLSSINDFLLNQRPNNQDIASHLTRTVGCDVVPLLDIINKK